MLGLSGNLKDQAPMHPLWLEALKTLHGCFSFTHLKPFCQKHKFNKTTNTLVIIFPMCITCFYQVILSIKSIVMLLFTNGPIAQFRFLWDTVPLIKKAAVPITLNKLQIMVGCRLLNPTCWETKCINHL